MPRCLFRFHERQCLEAKGESRDRALGQHLPLLKFLGQPEIEYKGIAREPLVWTNTEA